MPSDKEIVVLQKFTELSDGYKTIENKVHILNKFLDDWENFKEADRNEHFHGPASKTC